MARKPFTTFIDLYAGPGFGLHPTYRGTYAANIIPQHHIDTYGIGAPSLPAWLTIADALPVGAWTTQGFGMDARFADQVAHPVGTNPQWWVLYTDRVIYHVGTPYYRAYLARLPLPDPNVKTFNGRWIMLAPYMNPLPQAFIATAHIIGARNIVYRANQGVARSNVVLRPSMQHGATILESRPVLWPVRWVARPSIRRAALEWAGSAVTVPIIRQKKAVITTGTSVAATWTNPTLAGSALFAAVSETTVSAGGSGPTWTAPSGWTIAAQRNQLSSPQGATVAIFNIQNSAIRSGTETFSTNWAAGSPSPNVLSCYLYEINNLTSGGAFHASAGNGGSGSNPLSTGTITATTQPEEYLLAIFAEIYATGTPTFSSPTNSFVIEGQGNILPGASCTSDLAALNLATYSTAVTSGSTPGVWAALLCSFK